VGTGDLNFSGTGTTATASTDYIFGSIGTTPINANIGGVNMGGIGNNSLDVTFRIDLTGTPAVDFDAFWLQMQRNGGGTSNTISNPEYGLGIPSLISGLLMDWVAVLDPSRSIASPAWPLPGLCQGVHCGSATT
jgi:hypothetical protein